MPNNPFGLIAEETYDSKMDQLNDTLTEKMNSTILMLGAIASGNGGISVKSFADLKMLNRLGLASRVLRVGDQVECAKTSTVNATIGNSSGTAGITAASVNKDTFVHAIGSSENADYEFIWDGAAWHFGDNPVELSAFGITITGTPSVGDEIVVHETADVLIWDVIDIDKDRPKASDLSHTITLQLHDCYTSLQFDAREALFAFPEGLAAGTYHFTVVNQPWVSADVNKTFQFTLATAIPAGGQLILTNNYNATMQNTTIRTYSSASSETALESTTLVLGTGGDDLGQVTNAGGGNINSIQRALLGNNNYADSAIRQWINSDKPKGSVWAPQHKFDRSPSWLTTVDGFLYGMDEGLLDAVGYVEKTTALNTVSDGGGSVTSYERFFLLSRSELYGGKENNINEGDPYAYYSENSDLSAPGGGNDSNRIKYRNGSAQYWWMRSPFAGGALNVRFVVPAGRVNYNDAYNAYGVAPACCIV